MEKTTTRSTLSEAVFKSVGLSRNESSNLVDTVFNEILRTLTSGNDVKISSFGTFIVRSKKERIGRNPKTGEEVTIAKLSKTISKIIGYTGNINFDEKKPDGIKRKIQFFIINTGDTNIINNFSEPMRSH